MGAARSNDSGLCPVPRIGPMFVAAVQHIVVFLRAADSGGLHPHAGSKVCRAKAHSLQSGRACGDVFDMGDTGGGFDDHLKGNRFGPTFGALNRRYQRINGIDIFGTANLGDHDLI